MNKTIPILTGAAILIVLTLFNTTYTVNYHEVAVATRFGKPAGVVRDPGLHFKAPFFIDGVSKLDTRLQLSESNLETVLKGEDKAAMQAALKTLNDASAELGKAVYEATSKTPGAEGGGAKPAGKDDVIDAEYEVKDGN